MHKIVLLSCAFIFTACSTGSSQSPLSFKTELPKQLREISGISSVGGSIWAITDKPQAAVYKLDVKGKLLQSISIKNAAAIDVEAITADAGYLYIADIGDNNGDRVERKIFKVALSNLNTSTTGTVSSEEIEFTFQGEGKIKNKKDNNFDCEAIISYRDSLYLFTKDRQDKETQLYVLPKKSGKYQARYINTFDSRGLITDAAINADGTELALIGYHKGHTSPFIILFNNFNGSNFFSGKYQTINLSAKPQNWQLEGISYGTNNMLYFSCEETSDVPATLYGIKRDHVFGLNKETKKNKG